MTRISIAIEIDLRGTKDKPRWTTERDILFATSGITSDHTIKIIVNRWSVGHPRVFASLPEGTRVQITADAADTAQKWESYVTAAVNR